MSSRNDKEPLIVPSKCHIEIIQLAGGERRSAVGTVTSARHVLVFLSRVSQRLHVSGCSLTSRDFNIGWCYSVVQEHSRDLYHTLTVTVHTLHLRGSAVCVCVCVCVCERECVRVCESVWESECVRVCESVWESVCVYLCVCVCVCVCVCIHECMLTYSIENEWRVKRRSEL